MPPFIKNITSRFTDGVKGFSVGQKTIALIGIAVLVMGGIALSSWMTKPAYTPLFFGLQGSDANSVVEQLRSSGVPYEIADGGGTIMVPQEKVYDERMKAAAAGLPASTVGGYSLLDTMGVTSSEFQQSTTYKRAIEGELSKTIGSLEGVKLATVQLAIPKDTVFVEKKTEPTASVFIEPRAGVNLTSDQIQAITHLTSASIEGMDAKNVAVVDSKGNVLSAAGAGPLGGADKQATEYEAKTTAAVQAMLDRVLGTGNASVAVAAAVDTTTGERITETFTTPDGAPALNESSTSEQYEGTGGTGAGVLGPDNIAVPEGAAGDGTYQQDSETKNNAINKVTETNAIPAGAIQRQTVSVVINQAVAQTLDIAQVRNMVTAAAGIDVERGDAVSVEMMPFSTTSADDAAAALQEAQAAEDKQKKADQLIQMIIGGLVLVAILSALLVYTLRNRRQNRKSVDFGPTETLDIEPTITPLAPSTETTVITAVEPMPEPEMDDPAKRRAQVTTMAETDPKKTAEYMRGMMDERN